MHLLLLSILLVLSVFGADYRLGDEISVKLSKNDFPSPSLVKFYFKTSKNTVEMSKNTTGKNDTTVMLHFSPETTKIGNWEMLDILSGTKAWILAVYNKTQKNVTTNLIVRRGIEIISLKEGQLIKETFNFTVKVFNKTSIPDLSQKSNWIVQLISGKSDKQKWSQLFVMEVTNISVSGNNYTLTINCQKSKGNVGYFMVGINQTNFIYYSVINDSLTPNNLIVVVDKNFSVVIPKKEKIFNKTILKVNGGGVSNYWWLVAENINTTKSYALTCKAQTDTNFGNFEWRVIESNGFNNISLSHGKYNLKIIWTKFNNNTFEIDSKNPQMVNINQNLIIQSTNPNQTLPIEINNCAKSLATPIKKSITIDVHTVFNSLYFEWRLYNQTNPNLTFNYIVLSSGTKKISKPGETNALTFEFPPGLKNSSYLYITSFACDNKTSIAHAKIRIDIASHSQPKKNPLSPGAIVGIVCAVVFLCGVAAWWICMRKKSPVSPYTQLD